MEKKHIIIIALIAILTILAIGIILSAGTHQEKKYEQYNFSSTCSIELPTWIKFNNGAGDLNSNSSIMGSNVASTTKSLFGNNEVMQITYTHSTVDGANVGANLNDNLVLEQNNKKVYTRTVMNEATGEGISVMGENEEVVNYIADHVKFNGTAANKTKNATVEEEEISTPDNTNNSPKNSNVDDANNKKYTQEDLNRARADGYMQGYDDSMMYYDDYEYGYSSGSSSSNPESSSSSSGPSSSSSRSNIETTT